MDLGTVGSPHLEPHEAQTSGTEHFWRVIDEARQRSEIEPVRLAQYLGQMLDQMSLVERDQLIDALVHALARADHWALLDAAMKHHRARLSSRAFLELRLWLVAQGQEVFELTLREPERLGELINGGSIDGGYYRSLGELVRDRSELARVLDNDDGDEVAEASMGAPSEAARQMTKERLAAWLRYLMLQWDVPARLWVLRGGLVFVLGVIVGIIASCGWWALLLVPLWITLASVVIYRRVWRGVASIYLRRNKDVGSARALLGHHDYEIHFDDADVSAEELARTEARVEVALAWIHEQAAAYGHCVGFACTAIERGVCERPPTFSGDVLEPAHGVELRRCVRARVAPRTPSFVLVFTREGNYRACAWPLVSPGGNGLEICVGPLDNTWPSTIAHEVLHLFGAQDFYFEGATEFDDKQRQSTSIDAVMDNASRILSDWTMARSIMRISSHPHAVVDPLTAHAVGWREPLVSALPERLETP